MRAEASDLPLSPLIWLEHSEFCRCTQIRIRANSFQDRSKAALTLEPMGVCSFIWICLCFGMFLVGAVSTMLGIEPRTQNSISTLPPSHISSCSQDRCRCVNKRLEKHMWEIHTHTYTHTDRQDTPGYLEIQETEGESSPQRTAWESHKDGDRSR